ncbi:tRNA modification GTPase TrmE [Rugosibacter aromaticivorans]|uniref:tRNA modification GTPase MnmE n=1 Tax=Rugosibacter aromaticivorans TaxID=1565605 RepID=A0A0C5JBS2_9PROT|nr:tRNA uridine-5-carboxymethylaminomethyl(34) synthesis GTPase MnmE [Rugosibacter aromaticivorans]AJP49293.1 tRNA modification GTPase TrmE [Rugosibacter aromaticivorans]TBR16536.1 MAG: tRNA uridine-5-carboxymethylaminomethyl(34) synthesis GTPase MnmE [Rugosibacter sp.]
MSNTAVSDTIAAIATAPGRGGIGVVRVSGLGLLPFAMQLCRKTPEPRRVTIADFLAADGSVIDHGLLLYFSAPHSFTGEDVIELQGHGGPVVMQILLARCVELGARIAHPGEFTQRAFLNEKMDLAQAEAVADLIDAGTAAAARSALRSLSGEFSREVQSLVGRLIELRMLIEATLDFPEEDIDLLQHTDAAERLNNLRVDLANLLSRARAGSLLRTGLHVVLTGLPNVGKSSLLNRLSGEDRAIVTEHAGTTRDVLRETIQINGIPLHVIDTAGLRATDDPIERVGIDRAWHEIGHADVILQLVDARVGITDADQVIAARLPLGVEQLVIENKSDLAGKQPQRFELDGRIHLCLSARSGEGVGLLRDELLRVAGWVGNGEDVVLARARHIEALNHAAEKSALAERRLSQVELCAEELRLAQVALSSITGEFSADDLLGEIFSRFCIGK